MELHSKSCLDPGIENWQKCCVKLITVSMGLQYAWRRHSCRALLPVLAFLRCHTTLQSLYTIVRAFKMKIAELVQGLIRNATFINYEPVQPGRILVGPTGV